MKVETEAFIVGIADIHSDKSGKDFVKFNLIVEGEFTGFFTQKKVGDKIRKNSVSVGNFLQSKQPTSCIAYLDVKFTQRGVFVDLEDIG